MATDYVTVQLKIDRGRGRAGWVLGVPINPYRVQDNAATNYLDSANLLTQPIRIGKRSISSHELETPDQMHTLFYELLLDAGIPSMGAYHYEVGDVFVENDPYYGMGATETEFVEDQFEATCLAYHGPPGHPCVGARLDRLANIYRPAANPTTDSIGPYLNETVGAGAELPLVLSGGEFSFGVNGATPAAIPVGVTTYTRAFGDIFRGVPSTTRTIHYFFYVPPLPGVELREGDRILIDGSSIAQSSAGRYVIQGPWVQYAGISGYQLICERMIANG